jgi:predicted RecA/RadA family phage recombinase
VANNNQCIRSKLKNMKVVKINAEVNLSSGMVVGLGSVLVIAEAYTDNKSQKDGVIPSQVATLLYQNEQAIIDGKVSIPNVADFNTTMSGNLDVARYETEAAEVMLIEFVVGTLTPIYGEENIEVITL